MKTPSDPSEKSDETGDSDEADDFDEAAYLAAHPDVRDAVSSGTMPSGLIHYLQWGRHEGRARRVVEPPSAERPTQATSWQDKVNEVWSVSPETKSEALGWYWIAHPMVRERINILVSGNQSVDAYARLGAWLEQHGRAVPLGRSVSLGCGFGGLERDLARRGMIREMDAYDLAASAINEARRLAEEAGFGWIRYYVADLGALDFPPGHYDAVFAHSSVHHVERLEALFTTVHRALRPGGIFHLNEYIGPTRFQWTDAQLQLINGYLDTLPERFRQTPNGRKPPVTRPTIAQMVAMDPTEAVRSADIREVLSRYFTIVEERPYGGALLHLGLADIAQNFDAADPEAVEHLRRFFDLEDTMMANGTIGTDFSVITAIRGQDTADEKHAQRRSKVSAGEDANRVPLPASRGPA